MRTIYHENSNFQSEFSWQTAENKHKEKAEKWGKINSMVQG